MNCAQILPCMIMQYVVLLQRLCLVVVFER